MRLVREESAWIQQQQRDNTEWYREQQEKMRVKDGGRLQEVTYNTPPAEPEYVGLFPPAPVQVAEEKPWNPCKVCGAKYNKTFAHFYPCGHPIKVREWLSPIPVGRRGGEQLMEDSWLVTSQGTAARHPLRAGAIAELRKKLGAA
jgi:hypothetical protein